MRVTQTLGCINFYFEINDSKLDNEERLKEQLNGVIGFLFHRYKERYKLDSGFIDFTVGNVEDQILRDKSTLKISFPKAEEVEPATAQ